MKRIIFIVGPTASGKSDVALNFAQKINGEIVCCDSMQIYKEISLASNKPSLKERESIKHYMLDVASVEESYNVVQFATEATKVIEEIHSRNVVPIVVGGSGLYIQILLDGIFEGKGHNESMRNEFKKIAREQGNEVLYDQLKKVDPKAAEKIHPNDVRRVIRGLEVFHTAQQPISELQVQRKGLWGNFDILFFGLRMDRQRLYEKINERVDTMIDDGLVDEIQQLQSLNLSLTAKHLIGVKEILDHLNNECDLEEATEKMKQNTRNFAKRQLTWFRKEKRISWIDVDERSVEQIVEYIAKESAGNG